METLSSPQIWVSLLQIIGVNIVLSGDNAVVIALAARSLPPRQQRNAIVFGSTMILKLMERFPVIVTLGAALLGWIAGEMGATDLAIREWTEARGAWTEIALGTAGAAVVVVAGKWLAARQAVAGHRVA